MSPKTQLFASEPQFASFPHQVLLALWLQQERASDRRKRAPGNRLDSQFPFIRFSASVFSSAVSCLSRLLPHFACVPCTASSPPPFPVLFHFGCCSAGTSHTLPFPQPAFPKQSLPNSWPISPCKSLCFANLDFVFG